MDECPHAHTGSCSPNGIYMYVVCMDCREILCESELGKKLRLACPGWEHKGHESHCTHCHHDADYHIKILTERVRELSVSASGDSGKP